MSKPTLTEAGFEAAANSLNCEVAAIKAVCEVEAPRGGFLADDRVRILFERHKFHRYSGGIFSKDCPDISNPKAGGYGAEGAYQWVRFSQAFALDPKAAMKSCSWGKFQIMGFNFAAAGSESLDDFVTAMKESEDEQLTAFVNFVKANAIADELRRHDWAGFARQYNGENYRINRYDAKLAAAYQKFSGQRSLKSEVGHSVIADLELVEPSTASVAEATTETRDDGTQTDTPASGAVSSPTAKEVKIAAMSPTAKTITVGMIATSAVGFIQQVWQSSQETVLSAGQYALKHLPMVLLILGIAALAVWIYNQSAKRAAARTTQIVEITANKDKNDVVIT